MYLDSNENLKAAVKYARRPKRPIRLVILFCAPPLKITPLETDHNVLRGILLNKKSSLQPFLKEKLRSHPWEILLKDGRVLSFLPPVPPLAHSQKTAVKSTPPLSRD